MTLALVILAVVACVCSASMSLEDAIWATTFYRDGDCKQTFDRFIWHTDNEQNVDVLRQAWDMDLSSPDDCATFLHAIMGHKNDARVPSEEFTFDQFMYRMNRRDACHDLDANRQTLSEAWKLHGAAAFDTYALDDYDVFNALQLLNRPGSSEHFEVFVEESGLQHKRAACEAAWTHPWRTVFITTKSNERATLLAKKRAELEPGRRIVEYCGEIAIPCDAKSMYAWLKLMRVDADTNMTEFLARYPRLAKIEFIVRDVWPALLGGESYSGPRRVAAIGKSWIFKPQLRENLFVVITKRDDRTGEVVIEQSYAERIGPEDGDNGFMDINFFSANYARMRALEKHLSHVEIVPRNKGRWDAFEGSGTHEVGHIDGSIEEYLLTLCKAHWASPSGESDYKDPAQMA